MAKQTINIGASANDGTGDNLRDAFDKINDNFTEVYTELGGTSLSNLSFSGNTISSDNSNGDINFDPNGTGNTVISSGNFLPASDSAIQNLGSPTDKWTNIYAAQMHVDSMVLTAINNTTIGATTPSTGAFTSVTVDNITIDGDDISSSGTLTLEGTINVAAGVVTGATSITSTAFVGNLTGNVTGNADTATTAGTVTTAAQPTITSVGTLTSLAVSGAVTSGAITASSDINGTELGLNGNKLVSLNTNSDVEIDPSGTGVVRTLANLDLNSNDITNGGTITATTFIGALTGNASTATTAGTVTTAAQPTITSVGTLTSLTVAGNILPLADSAVQSIGAAADQWTNIYAFQGHFERVNITGGSQSTVGSAGGASALPANPSGYVKIEVSGTEYVIPYYAVS